jgi:hypothetical protein
MYYIVNKMKSLNIGLDLFESFGREPHVHICRDAILMGLTLIWEDVRGSEFPTPTFVILLSDSTAQHRFP